MQPQASSTPEIQNQPQQALYSSAASSSGHGFIAFAEDDPIYVEELAARYEEQEYEQRRQTRRGGQKLRLAQAELSRQASKDRFPVLVGEVDALRRGLQQRRPMQKAVSWPATK